MKSGRAQRVDVSALVNFRSHKLLRRHVLGRTQRCTVHRQTSFIAFAIDESSEPEIGDLYHRNAVLQREPGRRIRQQ